MLNETHDVDWLARWLMYWLVQRHECLFTFQDGKVCRRRLASDTDWQMRTPTVREPLGPNGNLVAGKVSDAWAQGWRPEWALPLCSAHREYACRDMVGDVLRMWRRHVPVRMAHEPAPGSVVYVLRRESDGLVKIGTSTRLDERVRTLRRVHGPLDLLFTLPGDRELESELHARFWQQRVEGEWFREETLLAGWVASEGETLASWDDVEELAEATP